MTQTHWLITALTLTEVFLLLLVVVFFWRLRKSEDVLSKLRDKQEEMLNKLRFNAQLEQELMGSFEERQAELAALDQSLESRSKEIKKLIKQAKELSRSPEFLREIILTGHKRGKSAKELARATNLSTEEVELIIDQAEA